MKRFSRFLLLALLLGSCGQLLPGQSAPLSDATFDLGYEQGKIVEQSFKGSWRVKTHPKWIVPEQAEGQGDLRVILHVKRDLITSPKADQKTLSGVVEVEWQNGQESGVVKWTIKADQYLLKGQIAGATVTAQDVQQQTQPLKISGQSQGVIVTYASAQLRDAALHSQAQLQSMGSQNLSVQNVARTLDALSITPQQRDPLGSASLYLDTAKVNETIKALEQQPGVISVSAQSVLHATAVAAPLLPTDEFAKLQWAFKLQGYPAVWRDMEQNPYKNPVTVAVIDTGVRYDHPDLEGQLVLPGQGALDLVEDDDSQAGDGDGVDKDPTDPTFAERQTDNSHGTHVTGIIAARWGKNKVPANCPSCSDSGTAGASYKAPIKVLPIRALDGAGKVGVAQVVNAIHYAAGIPITVGQTKYENPVPVKVINLSLGGPINDTEKPLLCDAVTAAKKKGILVIAAAGNEGNDQPFYPAACPAAVAVASVSLSGSSAPQRASYSNFYSEVQLSAPGGDKYAFNGATLNGKPFADAILSTDWDYVKNQPRYNGMMGTSQAAPQVSALAALLLSKGLTSGPEDTLARLISTATDLGAPGRDPQFGSGMINAAAALGAPAIAEGVGLRLQSEQGQAYQPPLDATGRFTAYLPEGGYQVVAGSDDNGNGVFGEQGERQASKQVNLTFKNPTADVGTLSPK